MKTPRELLLHRHAAAVPKLDAVRAEVVGSLQPRPAATNWFSIAWQELFWNSRRVWASLAAVWAALLVCNVALTDRSVSAAVSVMAQLPVEEMRRLRQERAQLRAELLDGLEANEVKTVTPAPRSPGPRSDRRREDEAIV